MIIDVEKLRRAGVKVRVKHYRRVSSSGTNPRGGKTVVEVTLPDGTALVGESKCSRKENFNKRLGVRIALGRAMKIYRDRKDDTSCIPILH